MLKNLKGLVTRISFSNYAYLLTVLLKFLTVYQKEAPVLQRWLQNVKNSFRVCIVSPWCDVTKWSIDQEQDVSYARQTHTPPSAAVIPLFGIEQRKCPVLNRRPYHNFGPPISLFHPAFNIFQAGVQGLTPDPETYSTVRELLSASAEIYSTEKERVDSINDPLNELLGRAFRMDEGPGVKCDGVGVILQECGKFDAYLVLRDIKNEIGTGHSDPYNQGRVLYTVIK